MHTTTRAYPGKHCVLVQAHLNPSLCLSGGMYVCEDTPLVITTHHPSPPPRPTASTSTGRGVMSISGLSYGVVRVEEPGSMTSLTLQDVGTVMPGARIAVVRIGNIPVICKTDEIGEICVQGTATGCAYWGLQGKTAHTFR